MKALFLIPYPPGKAASQRFRFEQYLGLLEENNISCELSPFMGKRTWEVLYKRGYFSVKFAGFIIGFFRRLCIFFRLKKFNFIFIHREAMPIGPPFIEWLLAKVFRKKIIYDFDDAIWETNSSESNRFFSFLKMYSSVGRVCKWATLVSCGNEYLCNYAEKYNAQVVYNPTTIDTDHTHNRVKQHAGGGKLVLGWTGTHSTIRYLNEIVPVLRELENECDFEFCVISDSRPEFALRTLTYKPWNKRDEIDDLLRFNIGLMPLSDDPWTNGKCGLKALQYMALGIPALVSPSGVNRRIIDHGINGFICSTHSQWKEKLKLLVNNRQLLADMAKNTRKKVIDHYSVKSNSVNFINLFH